MSAAIVLVPARMAASRLPDKPMADIGGSPMIVHVWRRATEAEIGRVVVATDAPAIADAISGAGGEAVMTSSDHLNGTSRIYEALSRIGDESDVVVNLQGDLPTLSPSCIRAALAPLTDPSVDIATLCAEIVREHEATDPHVVKVVGTPRAEKILRVLYFTRATAPYGVGPLYHHIGLYAFRRSALDRYMALPPAPLETREKLEQLRALEAGMRFDAAIVDTIPLGVDTPTDLARARQILAGKGNGSLP